MLKHRRIYGLGTVLKLSKYQDPTRRAELDLGIKGIHRKIGLGQAIDQALFNRGLSHFDNSIMNKKPGATQDSTMKPCECDPNSAAFSFGDVCQESNRKSAIRLNFRK